MFDMGMILQNAAKFNKPSSDIVHHAVQLDGLLTLLATGDYIDMPLTLVDLKVDLSDIEQLDVEPSSHHSEEDSEHLKPIKLKLLPPKPPKLMIKLKKHQEHWESAVGSSGEQEVIDKQQEETVLQPSTPIEEQDDISEEEKKKTATDEEEYTLEYPHT